MDYILIGAGGHSKVVIDILKSRNEKVVGIVDDDPKRNSVSNTPILGSTEIIPDLINSFANAYYIVCVGDNRTRGDIVKRLEPLDLKYGIAVHPTAILGSNVVIKAGSVVMPNVVVNVDTFIGEHTILNTACTIDHECKVGQFVHISPGVNLAGNVQVGSFSHIGIGASVIQGLTIGSNSTIGAGSCVVNDIEDNIVAIGCPAKKIRSK